MEVKDFIEKLASDPEQFSWAEIDDGIAVRNDRFNTETHFSFKAIESHDWHFLEAQTYHGKNVEHMTRVTGYFSKVSGWNSGKRGELRDRHRNSV